MRKVVVWIVAAITLVGAPAGCGEDSSDDERASATSTTGAVTPGGTPRPDAQQSAAIEAGVASVYPGLPEGKAAEFAIGVCQDLRQGWEGAQLRAGTVAHFGGGDRPDPTDEQADQIVEVIRSSGYCATGG